MNEKARDIKVILSKAMEKTLINEVEL